MRAGTSTDDYLIIGDEWWTILDTSPGQCCFCGICTGMALYGPSWREDHISHDSYLRLKDNILLLDDSFKTRRFYNDWLSKYSKFVSGLTLDNKVPYTGWMLLLLHPFYGTQLEDLLFAPRAMEMRFAEGTLVEKVDLTDVLRKLDDAYPGDYSQSDL